ncbi:hypothetical protein GCM10009555_078180 [Acrocarpospora macrocephala]|uniref:Methyltransferase type 11 domain-containing protein n=1 Tax=Acrocarpospora macrocephala TaxID=150177 RepID=A0A5M3X5U7_9ACTN|nr:hypothetical protein Amac_100820 [Acrocarpospora macrocephala]
MAEKNGRRWNHNIHYHPRILRAIPEGAQRALDVGCGEGMLARELDRAARHRHRPRRAQHRPSP